jgi:hypothetical protein
MGIVILCSNNLWHVSMTAQDCAIFLVFVRKKFSLEEPSFFALSALARDRTVAQHFWGHGRLC